MKHGQTNVLLQRSNRIQRRGEHQHSVECGVAIRGVEGWVGEGSAVLTRFPELAWLMETTSPTVKTYWETEDRP